MDTELHRRRRLSGLLGLASLACLAWPAAGFTQQVTTPNGSVTIDYGVLNSVGQGQGSGGYGAQPSWPYSPSVNPYDQSAAANAYGQQAPYPYGQPAWGYRNQSNLQPLYPPPQYPVSSLLVPPPVGSMPYVPRAAAQPSQAPASESTAPAAPTSTETASTGTGSTGSETAPAAPSTS